MKFLVLFFLLGGFSASAAEECCTGSCWADGCCPGMPKCNVSSAAQWAYQLSISEVTQPALYCVTSL